MSDAQDSTGHVISEDETDLLAGMRFTYLDVMRKRSIGVSMIGRAV